MQNTCISMLNIKYNRLLYVRKIFLVSGEVENNCTFKRKCLYNDTQINIPILFLTTFWYIISFFYSYLFLSYQRETDPNKLSRDLFVHQLLAYMYERMKRV